MSPPDAGLPVPLTNGWSLLSPSACLSVCMYACWGYIFFSLSTVVNLVMFLTHFFRFAKGRYLDECAWHGWVSTNDNKHTSGTKVLENVRNSFKVIVVGLYFSLWKVTFFHWIHTAILLFCFLRLIICNRHYGKEPEIWYYTCSECKNENEYEKMTPSYPLHIT